MKNKQKKGLLNLVKIFLLLVIFLGLVQVYLSQRLASAGKAVADLEKEAAEISLENEKLLENLNNQGSLAVVFEKAQSLGFRPANEVLYFTSEVPVALNY